MKEISLTQGKFAQVDDADFAYLSRFSWCAQRDKHTWYAVGQIDGCPVKMHRVLLEASPGVLVDHWDGNGLNNQRHNLRYCTPSQNNRNARKQQNTTSRFKGVAWYRWTSKWQSKIKVDRKQIHLGYFTEEGDAARAYDIAAMQYHGQFARCNFPVGTSHNT